MMRALDKKVFETFEIFSEQFVRFFLALHYVFPHKRDLIDRVELSKKTFAKSSQVVIEFSAKLYSHFFARSLRAKGTKCNLTASSPNYGILIMRDTS